MDGARQVEDRLRAEYVDLLPSMQRTLTALLTEVNHQPPIGFKYHGLWNSTDPFRSELQIVSLLVGLFWEVEHSAIYKPTPKLQGIAGSISMKDRNDAVLTALQQFEQEFDRQIEGGD